MGEIARMGLARLDDFCAWVWQKYVAYDEHLQRQLNIETGKAAFANAIEARIDAIEKSLEEEYDNGSKGDRFDLNMKETLATVNFQLRLTAVDQHAQTIEDPLEKTFERAEVRAATIADRISARTPAARWITVQRRLWRPHRIGRTPLGRSKEQQDPMRQRKATM